MAEIFISYATEDQSVAKSLAAILHENGFRVFWDRVIGPGCVWNDEIQHELRAARCVIVLWSASSAESFWVAGEAAESFNRGTYFPVQIDGSLPPRLFRHVQAQSIANWVRSQQVDELEQLKSAIRARVSKLPMYGILKSVADGEPVTEEHLHLIHSCWRVDKQTEYGPMPYQIHVIVYGHPTARARIESVEYLLPEYPAGHDRRVGGPPERLFELKELANGFSIIQAHIQLRLQPPGHPRVLRISRLTNVSESGPRLFNDYPV